MIKRGIIVGIAIVIIAIKMGSQQLQPLRYGFNVKGTKEMLTRQQEKEWLRHCQETAHTLCNGQVAGYESNSIHGTMIAFARNGDVELVRKCIEHGHYIYGGGSNQDPVFDAMEAAACNGHLYIVKMLYEYAHERMPWWCETFGSDLGKVLLIAAVRSNFEIVNWVIEIAEVHEYDCIKIIGQMYKNDGDKIDLKMKELLKENCEIYKARDPRKVKINEWFIQNGFDIMIKSNAWIKDDIMKFNFCTYDAKYLSIQFDKDGEFLNSEVFDRYYEPTYFPLEKEHQRLIEVILNNVTDAYEVFATPSKVHKVDTEPGKLIKYTLNETTNQFETLSG